MLSSITSSLILALIISLIPITAPLLLGLMILIMALSISMSLALFSSTWLALVMFIIYIGGMLIMFAYFSALQPNKQLHPVPMAFVFMFFFLAFTYANKSSLSPSYFITPSISKLIAMDNFYMYLLLMIILLLTLIAVVKITTINKSPLRPFN